MGRTTYGLNNDIKMTIEHYLNESSIEIPVYIDFKYPDNVIEDGGCIRVELSEILEMVSELAKDVGEKKTFIDKIDNLWYKAKDKFQ